MGVINTFVNATKPDQSLVPIPAFHKRTRAVHHPDNKTKLGTPTVGSLLSGIQSVNSCSLLLGQCEDGLPLLIELGEPELGATLISCERCMGKTHQLQVMADSAVQLRSPSQLQLGVLTFKPAEWQAWETNPKRRKYLQGIYAWYDPWVGGLIQAMVDLAEARRDNQRLGADVLLFLDDLNFVEELSYEAQVNLHWLLEYGSQAGVWLVGAINAHRAPDFRYWVDAFRTRIIGQVKSERNQEILSLSPGPRTANFEPAMFRIWSGDDWRTYRLPLVGK